MAWPSSAPAYDNYDAGGDDPSLARSQLIDLRSSVASMIAARGAASGVCDLDASSKIPSARLPTLNYVPLGASGQLADANALVTAGFYYTGATWTGSVFAGTSGSNQGYLVHQTWANPGVGTNYHRQWFMPINAATYNPWIRIKNNGTWMPWVPLFTPEALAIDNHVIPFSVTAAVGDGVAVSAGPALAAVVVTVPAGKQLYVRRVRGFAALHNGNDTAWIMSVGGYSSYTTVGGIGGVAAWIDEDANASILNNSGGGSAVSKSVIFSLDYKSSGNIDGISTLVGYLLIAD